MKILRDIRGSMNLSESIALKAVSLLLALILWITILGFKREEIKKNVAFEPMLPPGMIPTAKIPNSIVFTLSGPRVLLKDVEKKIVPIRPDFRQHRDPVTVISMNEEYVGELPVGVKVVSIEPQKVIIQLEEVVERYIQVNPTITGSPAPGIEIASIKATPSKVAVAGAKSLVQALEFVGTEAIDVQDLSANKDGKFSVVVDTNQGYQLSRDKVVDVRITTRRVQKK